MKEQPELFDVYWLKYDVFIVSTHICSEIISSKELFLDSIARTFSYIYVIRGSFVQSVINRLLNEYI